MKTSASQDVQADPGDHGRQPAIKVFDRLGIASLQPKPGFLNGVVKQMARIEGVPKNQASLTTKLAYRFGPKMMMAMGKFNGTMRKGTSVKQRIQHLVELKGAAMIGCEYCLDLGSQICRNSGFSDEELLAMPNYRTSQLFTDQEKAALDFAVGFMRTPMQISDAVFADAQKYFSNQQLVEIAGLLTLVNLDRFNAAFGIGTAGFGEGMVCVPPERPVEVDGLKTAAG